jgi:hypothetical protein
LPRSGTLTDRAAATGILYNYLDNVSPEDVNGIKRGYVSVQGDNITARPVEKNFDPNTAYKMRPTMVASEEPMALIPKISPKDEMYKSTQEFSRTLLRSALRKIVDEV